MKAIDVTDENFERLILESGKTVLVDFVAEWCPPCKAMTPVIEELASDLKDKALVGTLDVDVNPEFTAKYGVRNLPSFLIFKEGKLVDKVIGAVPKSVLEKKITSFL
jgi:thioredoxin 1